MNYQIKIQVVYTYTFFSGYDYIHLWSGFDFYATLGNTWGSQMCDDTFTSSGGTKSYGLVCQNPDRSLSWDTGVRVIAHELGHALGAVHDWDTSCGNGDWIMGSGNKLFSVCVVCLILDLIFAVFKCYAFFLMR